MLYEKIENPKIVGMFDVTTVILVESKKCKRIYSHYDLGEKELTLFDIQQEFKDEKEIIVITEYGISGNVYRYGNHGDYWEKIGKTIGYA